MSDIRPGTEADRTDVNCPHCDALVALPPIIRTAQASKAMRLAVTALVLAVICAVVIGLGAFVALSRPDLLVSLVKQGVSDSPRLSQIEKSMLELRGKVASLSTGLSSQRWDLIKLEMKADRTTADLDPASPGPFSAIQGPCGIFFVSLKDADPYLDGVKIRLDIGNPMTCSYSGAKITVKFGPRFDSKRLAEAAYYAGYEKALQTKVVDVPNVIESGKWNTVEAVLSPLDPSQFGTLSVSIQTDTLYFMK